MDDGEALIPLHLMYSLIISRKYRFPFGSEYPKESEARTLGQEKVLVLCNLSEKQVSVDPVEGIIYKRPNLMLANLEVEDHEETGAIKLAPYEARIYKV